MDSRQVSGQPFLSPLTPGAQPRPSRAHRAVDPSRPGTRLRCPPFHMEVAGGQRPGQPAAPCRGQKKQGDLGMRGWGQVPGLGKVPGKTRRWSELAAVGGTLSGPFQQEALLAPNVRRTSLRPCLYLGQLCMFPAMYGMRTHGGEPSLRSDGG